MIHIDDFDSEVDIDHQRSRQHEGDGATNANIFIETCTLHDDQYLTFHELHDNGANSSGFDSASSGSGCESFTAKSHTSAGGFSFRVKQDSRFVIWRILGNRLELIEQSLLHRLQGNCKRIYFRNASVIPKVHIYEQATAGGNSYLVLLFATSSKLYRLIFPVRSVVDSNSSHGTHTSTFSELSCFTLSNADAAHSFAVSLHNVEQGDICVSERGEALFAFVLPNSTVSCVQMPPISARDLAIASGDMPAVAHQRLAGGSVAASPAQTQAQQANATNLPFKFELNNANIVKRLWSGIMSRANNDSQSVFVSYKLFVHKDATYIISLCKDFKLKVWCLKSYQCLQSEDLSKYVKAGDADVSGNSSIAWDECRIDAIVDQQGDSIVSVVIATSDQLRICTLRIVELTKDCFGLAEISKRIVQKSGRLLDMCLTSWHTWLMYTNEKENVEIATVPVSETDTNGAAGAAGAGGRTGAHAHHTFVINMDQQSAASRRPARSAASALGAAAAAAAAAASDEDNAAAGGADDDWDEQDARLIGAAADALDLKETYLRLIFEPYRFSRFDVLKSLGILRHSVLDEHDMPKSIDACKETLIKSVEREVQSHPSFGSCTEEEFLYLNSKCWSKYYTMLKQYDYESRTPLGLFVDKQTESHVMLVRRSSISTYSRADLAQFYHIAHIDVIKSFAEKQLAPINARRADTDANDMFHMLMSLRCINDYCTGLAAFGGASSILGGGGGGAGLPVDESAAASSFSASTSYQAIHALGDQLALTSKDFLSSLCAHLYKINNLDALSQLIDALFRHFDTDRATTAAAAAVAQRHSLFDDQMDQMDTTEGSTHDALSSLVVCSSDFVADSVMVMVRELATRRHDFFRNLAVFISVISRYNDKLQIARNLADAIQQRFFERCFVSLNAYGLLVWLSGVYPYHVGKSQLDRSYRRTIDLLDDVSYAQLRGGDASKDFDDTLVKAFMRSTDKLAVWPLQHQQQQQQRHQLQRQRQHGLDSVLGQLTGAAIQHLWPASSGCFDLVKYLMYNGQYVHLSNYCLQTRWWPSGKNLRYFLLAHCCLFFDNVDQSISLFLKASFNLDKEQCLNKLMRLRATETGGLISSSGATTTSDTAAAETGRRVADQRRSIIVSKRHRVGIAAAGANNNGSSNNCNVDSENLMLLDYYTKIIHYYDLNGNLEAAIELIQNALLKCQFDAASRSKLYCILFKSYMDLAYYDKAHLALMSNFDVEWKRTCLKHFVSELCNQGRTAVLVGFEYADMLPDVLGMLYRRAQASDLRTSDFYRVLYAVHVKHKDYRAAALCMYECAVRLRLELSTIGSLHRQHTCYLACLNLLRLVDRRFAWLVVPCKFDELGGSAAAAATAAAAFKSAKELKQRFAECRDNLAAHQKSGANGGSSSNALEQKESCSSNKSMPFELMDAEGTRCLVDADDINKNYLVVHYMIKLSALIPNQSSIATFFSVDEITSLLTKYGLFDDAITLTLAFKSAESGSPLINIMTSLVDRCCNFSATNESRDGSRELNYSEYEMIKNNDSFHTALSPYENPSSFKWKLLHTYLTKFNDVAYYKAVCKRVISLEHHLPHYITDSFQKLNSNALLQTYIAYGYWSEALALINEYISAILTSEGVHRFDIAQSLQLNKFAPVTFPYSLVDSLLHSLSKTQDTQLVSLRNDLKEKLAEYLDQIKDASESVVNLKRQQQQQQLHQQQPLMQQHGMTIAHSRF